MKYNFKRCFIGIIVLAIVICSIPILTNNVHALTYNAPLVADSLAAYIDGAPTEFYVYPGLSNDDDTFYKVGNNSALMGVFHAALKFDMSSATMSDVRYVKLKLHINELNGNPNVSIYGTADDAWDTNTGHEFPLVKPDYNAVNKNSEPSVNTYIGTLEEGGYKTFDVTEIAKSTIDTLDPINPADPVLSLIFMTDDTYVDGVDSYFSFNSMEDATTAFRPSLEITEYSAPTVTTEVPSVDIGITSATVNCNITDDGGKTVNGKGIQYKKKADTDYINATITDSETSFNAVLSELEPNTEYVAKAYATNEEGTAYSDPVNFTTDPVAVTNITVTGAGDATEITTLEGTLQMSAAVLPIDATNPAVTWTVTETTGDATTKATINATGLLTAVKNGTVRVTATSVSTGAITGIKNITITNNPVAVSEITVTGAGDATEITTLEGTLQMSAAVLPIDATNPAVTWTVTETTGDATTKATISATGLLTAVKNGTVRVTATSVSTGAITGIKNIAITNNPVAVSEITVTGAGDATEITTLEGTLQMSAAVLPTDATNPAVTWTVTETTGDATTKATISATGLLTAVKNGTVRVTATSVSTGAITGIKNITITNNPVAVSEITVTGAGDATEITTLEGTLQMSAAVLPIDATNPAVTWTVTETTGDATTKATISATGLLTAVKNGTVRVTATSVSTGAITGIKNITITNNPVAVSEITVTGAGDATEITTLEGTLQMSAAVLPIDATNPAVTWTVTETTGDATTKATISATGLLTAVKNGTVRVTATSVSTGAITGIKNITITNNPVAVSEITVTGAGDATEITTLEGTLQMSAAVLPTDATNPAVTWTVTETTGDATTKATISATGLLTAVKNGTVRVTATSVSTGAITGIKNITITNNPVAVSEITVTGAGDATEITTLEGTLQMSAAVLPTDATNPAVTWTVTETTGDATTKATISATGLLTAVKNGTVRVTATSVSTGAITGIKNITITNNPVAVSEITVTGAGDATEITTLEGTLQMSAAVLPIDATNPAVTWTVTETTGDATTKATISATGLLTAVKNGTVRVTATSVSTGAITGIKNITITNNPVAVSEITVTGAGDATEITTLEGTLQMSAAVLPTDATNPAVTWTVTETTGDATTKATISATGLLTAVKNGTVRVTATSVSTGAITGIKNITITNNPVAVSEITVTGAGDATEITTLEGTLQMSAAVLPTDATNPAVTWTVTETTGDATTKATISATGLLTAVKNGTVRVTATSVSTGAITGIKNITITNNPVAVSEITVTGAGDATEITTLEGTLQMSAAVLPIDATNPAVTWTVTETTGDATTKATISATGLLTAVKNGTVRVTATSVSTGAITGIKNIAITNNPVAVSEITVTGAGDATEITTLEGTLQMSAAVLPTDATNPAVTWTVTETTGDATTKATISATGLLTAVKNGTVRVTATSVSTGAITGIKNITITNNPVAVSEITVTGAGDATEITTLEGTLQMSAAVLPTDATNPAVIWTVTEDDGITATTKATISATGLLTAKQVGTVRVIATSVSNGTVFGTKDITITNNPPPTPTTHTPTDTSVEVIVNGKVEKAATSVTTTVGDKTVTTVTLDDKKIEQKLETEGNNSKVTIPVNNNSDVVIGQLSGATVKNMESKEAVLEIKTDNVTYTLPASEINIDDVSSQIGNQVELKDIKVSITIATPSKDTVKFVEDTAKKNSYQIVVKPVQFEIACTSGGKTIDVSKFNGYVERTVAIPDGIDPSKITTGIVLNADGTFSHVPTTIINLDGKYYAKINSLTNSTYSVIWNETSFKDMEGHWAKEAVNDLGSRLVINGVDKETFSPNKDITRAEFASIVVKALGLMRPDTGKKVFSDVKSDDWYYDAVSIAYERGIVKGYNGAFKPMDKITREEAMAMLSRAMEIAKLENNLSVDAQNTLLAKFNDGGQVSVWAKESIAACLNSKIVIGTDNNILPVQNITRAETAVIIRRMLKTAGLI